MRHPLLLAAAVALAAGATAGAGDITGTESSRLQNLFTQSNPSGPDRSVEIASWEMLGQTDPDPHMGVGNLHPIAALAAAARFDAVVERRHDEELAAWSDMFSRDPYPNMGLGGHKG